MIQKVTDILSIHTQNYLPPINKKLSNANLPTLIICFYHTLKIQQFHIIQSSLSMRPNIWVILWGWQSLSYTMDVPVDLLYIVRLVLNLSESELTFQGSCNDFWIFLHFHSSCSWLMRPGCDLLRCRLVREAQCCSSRRSYWRLDNSCTMEQIWVCYYCLLFNMPFTLTSNHQRRAWLEKRFDVHWRTVCAC